MPIDFHHNIFYFYRGSQEASNEESRQLEDNVTKALINTLENIDIKITEKFLRYIGVVTEIISNVHFKLQKNDIGASALQRKKELILLAIVPEKKQEVKFDVVKKHSSRPDAWIYGNNFAILIESKIVGYLDYSQMKEHYRKLSSNSTIAPKSVEITWTDIQLFFKKEINFSKINGINEADSFLIKQFKEYLDMCNLTDFNGFDADFFDYFFTHDDEESRIWVKKKINSFSSQISKKLSEIDSGFYQDYDQGRLKFKDSYGWYFWVAFGPKNRKYRKFAHLSMRFTSQGIQIFINLELKQATDSFKNKINQQPTELQHAIEDLCDGKNLTFLIEKRIQKRVSLYDYRKLLEIESYSLKDDKLASSTYDFLLSVINRIDLPSINIIKKINRTDAIDLSGGDDPQKLVNKVNEIATEFHKFISFINEPYKIKNL